MATSAIAAATVICRITVLLEPEAERFGRVSGQHTLWPAGRRGHAGPAYCAADQDGSTTSASDIATLPWRRRPRMIGVRLPLGRAAAAATGWADVLECCVGGVSRRGAPPLAGVGGAGAAHRPVRRGGGGPGGGGPRPPGRPAAADRGPGGGRAG